LRVVVLHEKPRPVQPEVVRVSRRLDGAGPREVDRAEVRLADAGRDGTGGLDQLRLALGGPNTRAHAMSISSRRPREPVTPHDPLSTRARASGRLTDV